MHGYQHNNLVYVKVPKNGCMSYSAFFESHGWKFINLNENDLDLDNTVFFGHVTDPHVRHTKGVVHYLQLTGNNDLLDDPRWNKLLVTGVFDEHCYSINMMIPHLIDRVHWIPLDFKWNEYDGTYLTNRFLRQQGLDIQYQDRDRLNVADAEKRARYAKLDLLKEQHSLAYQQLVKNFLEVDIMLHAKTVDTYNHVNFSVDI